MGQIKTDRTLIFTIPNKTNTHFLFSWFFFYKLYTCKRKINKTQNWKFQNIKLTTIFLLCYNHLLWKRNIVIFYVLCSPLSLMLWPYQLFNSLNYILPSTYLSIYFNIHTFSQLYSHLIHINHSHPKKTLKNSKLIFS